MTNYPAMQKENAVLWMVKVIAGALLLGVLGLHLVVNHLTAPEGLLSYADVVRYFQNPLVVAMEITFLVIVITHALIGLRSILLDLKPSAGVLRLVDGLFIIVGIVGIVYGTWLALTIASRIA